MSNHVPPLPWQHVHAYLVRPDGMDDPVVAEQATAEFLLTRGPYAWIGYGWLGCSGTRPRPNLWDTDFGGEPEGTCAETGTHTGVFVRQYPKATVQWDCNAGQGSILQHEPQPTDSKKPSSAVIL